MAPNETDLKKSLVLKVDQIVVRKRCGERFDVTGTVTAVHHDATCRVVAALAHSSYCKIDGATDGQVVWGPRDLTADSPMPFSITLGVSCQPSDDTYYTDLLVEAKDDDNCSDTDKVHLTIKC